MALLAAYRVGVIGVLIGGGPCSALSYWISRVKADLDRQSIMAAGRRRDLRYALLPG